MFSGKLGGRIGPPPWHPRLGMWRTLTHVLMALAIVVLAVPAFAQTGRIQGKVTDEAGKPVDGAKITVSTIPDTGGQKWGGDQLDGPRQGVAEPLVHLLALSQLHPSLLSTQPAGGAFTSARRLVNWEANAMGGQREAANLARRHRPSMTAETGEIDYL